MDVMMKSRVWRKKVEGMDEKNMGCALESWDNIALMSSKDIMLMNI
jgi:hypothetical protein